VIVVRPNGGQGRETVLAEKLRFSKKLILFIMHVAHERPQPTPTAQRDERIRQRYAQGETLSDLAREYGISP